MFHCDVCNIELDMTSKSKHLRSFKHNLVKTSLQNNNGSLQDYLNKPIDAVETTHQRVKITQPNDNISSNVIKPTLQSDNLDDLRNDVYTVPTIEIAKPKGKKSKKVIDDDDDASIMSNVKEIFSDKGSKLFGKDNLELINKIKQYKALFPKELSKLRVKKNATTDDLNKYLEEIDFLINASNVDTFVIDTILNTLQMAEPLTARTKYNITGLTMMLKANPQFNSLSKQLYLKYGSFVNVPPESQMLLLIFSMGYICIQKNNQKDKLNDFLNQPATPQTQMNNM